MAINAYGQNIATNGTTATASTAAKDKTALGKDDFMKLLLVELQHQDPTAPTDTDKILTQTSELATMESTDNTNKALENLSKTLGSTNQFSTIAAIGKTADLGSDAISHEKGSSSTFEVYFPKDVDSGTISITDSSGSEVGTVDVGTQSAGVHQFTWDGKNASGADNDSGTYSVKASYKDKDGNELKTKLGAYPIEAVRFDQGKTLVKLGSNYVPLANVKEVY